MESGIWIAVAAIGGNLILGVGLVATWIKNGRASSGKYGELKSELSGLVKNVAALTSVVTDTGKKVDKFQLHFADVSGRMDERIKNNEGSIDALFKKAAK